MDLADQLAAIERESAALAEVVVRYPEAPVAACPGWDVAELGRHTGSAHRWALANIAAHDPEHPVRGRTAPADMPTAAADVADWLRAGAAELVRTVRADRDAATWTLDGTGVASFWARRHASETAVHRWDGQTAAAAVGGPAPDPIEVDLAVDAIDESFMMMGLMLTRGAEGPSGSCHLHRTDGPGEWMLRIDDGRLAVTHEHGKGDCAVRGSASDLLLYLWTRKPAADLEVFGDAELAQAWGRLTP
jgi:uncharacterized protein (TIGR03083 family)